MKTINCKAACPVLLAIALFALFAFGCTPTRAVSDCGDDHIDNTLAFPDLGFDFEGTCDDIPAIEEKPAAEPKIDMIDIKQAVNGIDAEPTDQAPSMKENQHISWSYKVMNTGKVKLTNVRVTNDALDAITCPQSDLAVGESMTCTVYDTAQAGSFEKKGCAVGDYVVHDDNGVIVTTMGDCDTSHYVVTTLEPQNLASLNAPTEMLIP